MKRVSQGKLLMGTPFVISGLSIFFDKYFCAFVSIVMLFLCIAFCKACDGHESLYCFVLFAFISIPINVEITRLALPVICSILIDTLVLRAIYFPMVYILILSLEEILIGVIGRLIWRHQEDFFECSDQNDYEDVI